ncbi:hypothetical protein [Roseovarius sp. MMSF_3281]|uniref:hypothetical protein n=1 Tax=Roseovarius sp. MMSF_3281 TaxID=3046694 RepID=UPI00273E7FC3|nr:hypothetical protein [Roseovarius sp. MMSF_3281]
MTTAKITTGVAALTLAACTTVQPAGTTTLGANPALDGGSFSSGGGLTVAAELRESAGRVAVCGVWAQSERQSVLTKFKAARVVDTGSVAVNGETLVHGLGFMPEVAPMADYAGAQAACVRTEQAWSANMAQARVDINIARQVVERDVSQSGVMEVVFKPTGPGAGG